MLRIIRLFLVIFVMISGLALHMRNDQAVTFDYYLGSVDFPFSFYLITALVAGTALGIFSCSYALIRLRQQNRVLRRKLVTAGKELDNLRTIPARD